MSKIDGRVSAVTPDGFRLEPTYDHLVAETGYDPGRDAAQVYADSALPVEISTPAGRGAQAPPIGPRVHLVSPPTSVNE